jgi:hypothetical protein
LCERISLIDEPLILPASIAQIEKKSDDAAGAFVGLDMGAGLVEVPV